MASEHRSLIDRRMALAEDAKTGLHQIADALKAAIMMAATSATATNSGRAGWSIQLNNACLEFTAVTGNNLNPWGEWEPPVIDVISHATIGLHIPPDRYGFEGRSHSLWFCDAQEAGRYKWFETAFMVSPLIPKRGRQNPFALNPGIKSAKALWKGVAELQLAWPFMPLNIAEFDEFIDRWANWFAEAALGRLQQPNSMPERPTHGSWRNR